MVLFKLQSQKLAININQGQNRIPCLALKKIFCKVFSFWL